MTVETWLALMFAGLLGICGCLFAVSSAIASLIVEQHRSTDTMDRIARALEKRPH